MASPLGLEGLSALVMLPGLSGHEGAVAEHVLGALAAAGLPGQVDRLGNVVCWAGTGRPVGLITAHMDQVGFMVSRVERDHAVCLSVGAPAFGGAVGVQIVSGLASGRAGVLEDGDAGAVLRCVAVDDLSVGDRVLPAPTFAGDGHTVTGVALDDRLGCWLLLRLAGALAVERPDLAFVWTVREETDASGALLAARRLEPEWHLAIDTTDAAEHADDGGSAIRVGGGPAVTLLDEGLVVDRVLLDLVTGVAGRQRIRWQPEVVGEGISEAGQVQSTLGIPALAVLVPLEQPHSAAESAAVGDILDTLELLRALLLATGGTDAPVRAPWGPGPPLCRARDDSEQLPTESA